MNELSRIQFQTTQDYSNYQPAPEAIAFEIAQTRARKAAEKAERKRNLDEQSKQREKGRKARRRAELIEQAEHDPEIAAKLEAEKEKRRA